MVTPELLRDTFSQGLPYDAYVATGSPDQQRAWSAMHGRVGLTADQRTLLGTFVRAMPVLVSSGTWCGDCVQQCPMFDHIAKAAPGIIDLRFIDRDQHRGLTDQIKICGGLRVPTAVFMNEDFEFVSILGDRSLTRYRAIAARSLGTANAPRCAAGGFYRAGA